MSNGNRQHVEATFDMLLRHVERCFDMSNVASTCQTATGNMSKQQATCSIRHVECRKPRPHQQHVEATCRMATGNMSKQRSTCCFDMSNSTCCFDMLLVWTGLNTVGATDCSMTVVFFTDLTSNMVNYLEELVVRNFFVYLCLKFNDQSKLMSK